MYPNNNLVVLRNSCSNHSGGATFVKGTGYDDVNGNVTAGTYDATEYLFSMQLDGRLLLYWAGPNWFSYDIPTSVGAFRACMFTSGNFAAFDARGNVLWSLQPWNNKQNNTVPSNARLFVRNDGNICVSGTSATACLYPTPDNICLDPPSPSTSATPSITASVTQTPSVTSSSSLTASATETTTKSSSGTATCSATPSRTISATAIAVSQISAAITLSALPESAFIGTTLTTAAVANLRASLQSALIALSDASVTITITKVTETATGIVVFSSARRLSIGAITVTYTTSGSTTAIAAIAAASVSTVNAAITAGVRTVYSGVTATTVTTTTSSTPEAATTNNTGAIIGGVIGGVVFLVVLGGAVLFCCRKPKLLLAAKATPGLSLNVPAPAVAV
jgi:hypothetical protein